MITRWRAWVRLIVRPTAEDRRRAWGQSPLFHSVSLEDKRAIGREQVLREYIDEGINKEVIVKWWFRGV